MTTATAPAAVGKDAGLVAYRRVVSAEPGNDGDHAARALSFGHAAERYDRWRPGYPDALYDDVLALSPGGRVLEAGAGTGKATVGLARRGASVLAVEADPAMAAVLRRRTSDPPVVVQESKFEDCDIKADSFDLVVAAQAWHWVDPERGPAVAARALDAGGSICLWVNRPREITGPVWDAIGHVYASHAPALDRRPQLRGQTERERTVAALPGFQDWTLRYYDWSAAYDAESYTQMIGTHSDHLALPGAVREQVLDRIARVIADLGAGYIDYPYRTVLLTAQPIVAR